MTVAAKTIIQRAAEQLQDVTATRFKTDKLVRDLNAGQRQVILKRPDAATATLPTALVAGSKQSIPATAATFIDIDGNTSGRAMRKVEMSTMDAFDRDWQTSTGSLVLDHFMWDQRDPRTFYVYPNALLGAQVDIVCALYPVDITVPGSNATWNDVAGDITVNDEWANALLDYVLAMAWSMDAEFAENAALASVHLQLFNAAIGEQLQSASAVAPTK